MIETVESVRQCYDGKTDQPDPIWVRGVCPRCGASVVSNAYYSTVRSYFIALECWASLGKSPTCDYRKIL